MCLGVGGSIVQYEKWAKIVGLEDDVTLFVVIGLGGALLHGRPGKNDSEREAGGRGMRGADRGVEVGWGGSQGYKMVDNTPSRGREAC